MLGSKKEKSIQDRLNFRGIEAIGLLKWFKPNQCVWMYLVPIVLHGTKWIFV